MSKQPPLATGFITEIPGTVPLPAPDKHPRPKGVGVLGLHEGRTLLIALQTRCRYANPVAACDLDAAKLAASRAELPDLFYTPDYAAMLARPEVDIVAIYTPDALHAEHIEQAFDAGKDVLCTKPLTNSLDAARRILEAGRRTGRRLLVGQSTRFFEPFRRQRALLERGGHGGLDAVEMIDAHYIHRMDWYYRKSPWAATDTDWVFLGMSHPIDLIRWYLGRIATVHAVGGRSRMGTQFGVTGRDMYLANFTAEDGRIGRAMGHYGCHELPTARNCIECMIYASGGSSLAQYHDMRFTYTADNPPPPRGGGDSTLASSRGRCVSPASSWKSPKTASTQAATTTSIPRSTACTTASSPTTPTPSPKPSSTPRPPPQNSKRASRPSASWRPSARAPRPARSSTSPPSSPRSACANAGPFPRAASLPPPARTPPPTPP